MKATELRIGNLINHLPSPRNSKGEGIVTVETIRKETNVTYVNSYDCFYEDDCEEVYYEPIPLTEEWLVKFGFKRTYDIEKAPNSINQYQLDIDDWTLIWSDIRGVSIANYEDSYYEMYFKHIQKSTNSKIFTSL